jgi:hypothetical protein
MKTIYNYTNIFILLLISQVAFANVDGKSGEDEVREVKASYKVVSGDQLKLSNKYGDIAIDTWDRNEVSVVITITAWGRNTAAAKENLNRVEIKHEKRGKDITFLTDIQDRNSSNRNNKSGFEVNYEIKMPKSLKLNLTNKFGDVSIAEHTANLYVKVQHGEFKGGELISENQEINVSFGEVDIEALGSGELNVRHGECTIGKAQNLKADIQFGAFSIDDKVNNLDLVIRHGSLEIDQVSKLTVESAHGSIDIGTISTSAVIESQHGSVEIDKLKKGFSKLDIESQHGSVEVDLEEGLSGSFEVETYFGGFDYDRDHNVNLQKEIKKNNHGVYEGTIGGGNGGKIYITTEHGSVEFE